MRSSQEVGDRKVIQMCRDPARTDSTVGTVALGRARTASQKPRSPGGTGASRSALSFGYT